MMNIYIIQDVSGKTNLPPIVQKNDVDFFRMIKGLPEDHYLKLYCDDFRFCLGGLFYDDDLERPLISYSLSGDEWKPIKEIFTNEV